MRIETGFKVIERRAYGSKVKRPVIVPAWRVADGPRGDTAWTSVESEAREWMTQFKEGYIPIAAYW